MEGEQRSRTLWERLAPDYDRWTAPLERRFLAVSRPWVCARASGDVLEVGIGTGANLPYYRAGVRITGLEPSPVMLDAARRRAGQPYELLTLPGITHSFRPDVTITQRLWSRSVDFFKKNLGEPVFAK